MKTPAQIIADQPNQQEKDKQELVAYIGGGVCTCGDFKICWSLFCQNCWAQLLPEWREVIRQTPIYSTILVRQFDTAVKYLQMKRDRLDIPLRSHDIKGDNG
jgi:hypothetical protein